MTFDPIRAAAQEIVKVAADVLYRDPHQWSLRGCQTCQVMSTLLGFEFGCVRYAKERK